MSVYKISNSSYSLRDIDIEKLPTLHRYVWKSKLQKILLLLSNKENHGKVKKVDYCERTPLHLASSKGDVKVLQFLLSVDATNINSFDNNGCSPFFKACQVLSLKCMKILVSYGAHTNCVDFDNHSIIDKIVIESGDGAVECLQYLLTNQKHETLPRDSSSTNQQTVYLSNGKSITNQEQGNISHGVLLNNALHIAVKYGRINVVALLLELGVDVDLADNDTGMTPLMRSVKNGFFCITQKILQHDANITLTDNHGNDVKSYTETGSKFYQLIEEYDNTRYDLDSPTTNKVFVTFHNFAPMNSQEKKSHDVEEPIKRMYDEEVKKDLLVKITEMENEIKRSKSKIKNGKMKTEELNKQLACSSNNLTFSNPESFDANTIKIESQRPKALTNIFKFGYQSKEEWVEEFDQLVDKYDELQRGYEKLLLVESEKECEIEDSNEVLRGSEKSNLRDGASITKMKNELEKMQNEVEEIRLENSSLHSEIQRLKEVIPIEKSKFKREIEEKNVMKSELMKNLKTSKLTKEQKMEELQIFREDENDVQIEIERCDEIIIEQDKAKTKLVDKIKLLKSNAEKAQNNIDQI